MKKFLLTKLFLLGLIFTGSLNVFSQDYFEQKEFFVGYMYTEADYHFGNGFQGAGTYNVHKYLGLKGRFTWNSGDGNSTASYHAGIQIKDNRENRRRVRPFGHLLVGGQRWNGGFYGAFSDSYDFLSDPERVTKSGASIAIGAGADVEVSERVSIRLIEYDYSPVWFNGEMFSTSRFSIGLVFR